MTPARLILIIALALFVTVPICGQTENKPSTDDKAEAIVRHAIEVVGGDAYLKVRTIISRGYYSQYKDGVSQLPAKFVDYIVYPDKERTEFLSGGVRLIQTNFGEQGWVFD